FPTETARCCLAARREPSLRDAFEHCNACRVRSSRREEEVMTSKPRSSGALEGEILLTGLAFGESPRWHENRLWFSNWGAQQIVAVDLKGKSEVMVRVSTTIPFSIDWLPDRRLLVVSGREGLLLRREADGTLVTHADLRGLSEKSWNEIVVDGRGNT